jgi:hypothetical protein
MCDELVKVAQAGGHVPAMCRAIGVRSKDTFYRWLTRYPEFNEAYEEAKLASQELLEQLLVGIATGKVKGNFNAVAMLLNNKFRKEYSRNVSGSNTEINIGAINTIEGLDDKKLDEKIKSLQAKLNLIPNQEAEDEEHILPDN